MILEITSTIQAMSPRVALDRPTCDGTFANGDVCPMAEQCDRHQRYPATQNNLYQWRMGEVSPSEEGDRCEEFVQGDLMTA